MRFLAAALLALFIGGGCARYNVRTTFDRERGTVTEVESRGISMNPEGNIYAVGAHQQGAVYADTYSATGGYMMGVPMTDADLYRLRLQHAAVDGGTGTESEEGLQQRVRHLEQDVEEARDGVDGVAESQRRLIEGLRGRGGRR